MVPPGIPDWFTRYQVVERSPVELVGFAWSAGNVPVAAVGGARRERAELDRSQGDFAWRYCWNAKSSEYILARYATYANGETQPLNRLETVRERGKNAMQRVRVTVS